MENLPQSPPQPETEPQPISQPQVPEPKPKSSLLLPITLSLIMFVLGGALVFAWFTFLKPEKVVPQPIASPSAVSTPKPSPTPAIPADWKTYKDATYSYSIKYPPTWIVSRISEDPEEKERRVDFLSAPIEVGKDFPIMVSITVYDNPSKLSATEWVEKQAKVVKTDDPKRTIVLRNVSVAGMSAVRVVGFPSQLGTMEVYLTKGLYTYVFVLTPYDKTRNEIMLERIELFELILSTFRFLD